MQLRTLNLAILFGGIVFGLIGATQRIAAGFGYEPRLTTRIFHCAIPARFRAFAAVLTPYWIAFVSKSH